MLKKISLFILISLSLHVSGMGSKVGLKTAEKVGDTLKELAPEMTKSSENFGKNAGLETVKEAGSVIKCVSGLVAAVYGAKYATDAYAHAEQQRAKEQEAYNKNHTLIARCNLNRCCMENIEAPRTECGVPLPCQKEAAHVACHDGQGFVDKKMAGFNKYAPAPTQTREEYEAKQKKAVADANKWFWQRG